MIGNWNDNGCVFALLPDCIRLGDHPNPYTFETLPYYFCSDYVIDVLYDGDDWGEFYSFNVTGNGFYNNGIISDYLINFSNNIYSFIFGENYPFTITSWLRLKLDTTNAYSSRFFQMRKPTFESYYELILKISLIAPTQNQNTIDFFDRASHKANNYSGEIINLDSFVHVAWELDQNANPRTYINGVLNENIVSTELFNDIIYAPIFKLGTFEYNTIWLGPPEGGTWSQYSTTVPDFKSFALYNTNIGPERIRNEFLLGPAMGGLQGHVNDNNVIELVQPQDIPKSKLNNVYRTSTTSEKNLIYQDCTPCGLKPQVMSGNIINDQVIKNVNQIYKKAWK